MPRRPLLFASLIGLTAIAPAAQGQQQAPARQTTPAPAPDPAAVEAVAAAIRTALAGLPEGAPQEDVEAVIIFAIDQEEATPDVAIAALAKVQAETTIPVQVAALTSVRALRTRLARGTGAIPGVGGGGLSNGPGLGTGGGSSDYE